MGFTLTLLFSADIAAVDSLVRRSCRAFCLAPVFELLIAIVHAVIPPSGLVADRAHLNHEHSTTQYSQGLEDGQLGQRPGHDPNLIAFHGRLSLVHQAGSVTVQLCSLHWKPPSKSVLESHASSGLQQGNLIARLGLLLSTTTPASMPSHSRSFRDAL